MKISTLMRKLNESVFKKAANVITASVTSKVVTGVIAVGIIVGSGYGIGQVIKSKDAVQNQGKIEQQEQDDRIGNGDQSALAENDTTNEPIPSVSPDEQSNKEESANTPTEPSQTESKAKQILGQCYLEHFTAKAAQGFFADLTHDGEDDMVVVYGDDMEGYIEVYTIKGEGVSLLYGDFAATSTNLRYAYGLYQEDGKDYLLNYGFFERQGFPWYFYKVYSLGSDEEIVYKEMSLEFAYDDEGNYDGVTEDEINQLHKELNAYANKSKLLMSGAGFIGMENDSMDMMYGTGDDFFIQMLEDNKYNVDYLMLTDEETIFSNLGEPISQEDWEIIYDGLEFFSNYGGIDTLHITNSKYSVYGIFVGQTKADALKALEGTNAVVSNGVTGYIFEDKGIGVGFEFAVIPYFSGDIVSEIWYQVYFGD